MSKWCGSCRRSFPASAEHFYRHAGRKDGLSDYCKACQLAATRAYRAKREANGGKPLGSLKIGDAKRCPDCDESKPWTREHFYVQRRDGAGRVVKLSARCKPCTRAHVAWIRSRDPEKSRARDRERHRERMQDPAYVERQREYLRNHRAKVKASATLHAADLERRRMNARLHRERNGHKLVPVETVTPLPGWDRSIGTLPAAPLVVVIEEWRGDRPEPIVEQLGISDRNLRAWRDGERDSVQFDVADRILVGIDLLWWEVWKEDEPGHERAAELFTGEKVAA